MANRLEDLKAIQNHILTQAVDYLLVLTNSLFIEKKYLLVESTLAPAFLVNLHAPLIELDFIYPDHWAWKPISSKKVGLTDIGLKNFLTRAGGTYAVIYVRSRDY